ncbi:MAG: hypothetical protein FWF81_04395 [Defluviitaleaceae bacterium]|nr:hypothetical protein [Defluviitaleaceae bacterium]
MYKILDSPKRMSSEQIKEKFKGKWVFLVEPEGSPFGWFNSAIPMVVADEPFEGSEMGIYYNLDDKYNGKTIDWTLPPFKKNVFGFNEVISE